MTKMIGVYVEPAGVYFLERRPKPNEQIKLEFTLGFRWEIWNYEQYGLVPVPEEIVRQLGVTIEH